MCHIYEYSQVISCVQKSVALPESLLMSHMWAVDLLHFCISKLINGGKKETGILGQMFNWVIVCDKLLLLFVLLLQVIVYVKLVLL